MNNYSHLFPQGKELSALLKLRQSASLEDLFSRCLTGPLDALVMRPGKKIRSQLVELGFEVGLGVTRNPEARERTPEMRQACQVLELLHAASLVIDDIQDEGRVRRGIPALHRTYGVPVALNAGNWLYFLPFQNLQSMDLPEGTRERLMRECHQTLLLGHYGQALDVGIPVDSVSQERVFEVVRSATELKSGALVGLALKLGALVAQAPDGLIDDLDALGRQLGSALQMLDDVGNFSSRGNPEKRGEDLRLKRLNFVFATAAQELDAAEYAFFLALMNDGPHEEVTHYLHNRGIISRARESAHLVLDRAVEDFERDIPMQAQQVLALSNVRDQLKGSYE